MLWVESSGIEVRSHREPLARLDDGARAHLDALRADPAGLWEGRVWSPASARPSRHGVAVGGDACSYFEVRARLAAGAPAAAWATLVALTADGGLVLTRRSGRVAGERGRWITAGGEGADADADASPSGPWDPLVGAARVATEELGCALGCDPAVVAAHWGPSGFGAHVAAVLDVDAATLARCAPAAPDAWERDALVVADPHDPGSWPPLGGVTRAACHAAVRRLVPH